MTVFLLKFIALIIMTFDHIGEYIPNMPIALHWVGRLSAPIFLFCTVQGFIHSSNRKRLILRLYLASVLMSLIQYSLNIQNNFFRVLFSLIVILHLIEAYLDERSNWKRYLCKYLIWQIGAICLVILLISLSSDDSIIYFIVYVLSAILGSIFNLEGGLVFVFIGLLFYVFRKSHKKLAISYLITCIMYFILTTTNIIAIVLMKIGMVSNAVSDILEYLLDTVIGLPVLGVGGSFLYQNYQWMMIFSLPFLLFYKGERGRKFKWFFYIYYPIHIVVLFIIGRGI